MKVEKEMDNSSSNYSNNHFGLGVKFYMDEEKLNKEMMNVVIVMKRNKYSKKRLTNLDPNAFTEKRYNSFL